MRYALPQISQLNDDVTLKNYPSTDFGEKIPPLVFDRNITRGGIFSEDSDSKISKFDPTPKSPKTSFLNVSEDDFFKVFSS